MPDVEIEIEQLRLVEDLLTDLEAVCQGRDMRVIIAVCLALLDHCLDRASPSLAYDCTEALAHVASLRKAALRARMS